jgi:hypothetical protein
MRWRIGARTPTRLIIQDSRKILTSLMLLQLGLLGRWPNWLFTRRHPSA